jgi:hypothetical protein
MRPTDQAVGEPAYPTMFELMMGMSSDEWDKDPESDDAMPPVPDK